MMMPRSRKIAFTTACDAWQPHQPTNSVAASSTRTCETALTELQNPIHLRTPRVHPHRASDSHSSTHLRTRPRRVRHPETSATQAGNNGDRLLLRRATRHPVARKYTSPTNRLSRHPSLLPARIPLDPSTDRLLTSLALVF
jgi:hypothetical protein